MGISGSDKGTPLHVGKADHLFESRLFAREPTGALHAHICRPPGQGPSSHHSVSK